jgi:hypothetical protein
MPLPEDLIAASSVNECLMAAVFAAAAAAAAAAMKLRNCCRSC